uniref:GH3 domain containing n=1 Tax=Pavo cristatus TaxID=9049 RepID=A0A8C9FN42_PAVCR
MLSAALPGMLLAAVPGVMLAAVVALLVAVCVLLPSAPPLRHRLLRAALLRASGWQRRRLELQSTDVRHGQERRLRRLLPPGARRARAAGSGGLRGVRRGRRPVALPCSPPGLSAQGALLYLHALHRTFPQALTLRGTALLGWASTASRAPGFCPLPTLYCTPPEATALPLRSAALRVQLLFALQTRALRVLEARLPNELHDALVALRDGWAELAHDLALGTLSPQPGLPEEMRGECWGCSIPPAGIGLLSVPCGWAFCEFLPCPADEEEEQRTVLLGELWEGREYKLILTAQPGEYRCRAGEVLRVAGFHKQCPVPCCACRESQALSVRGESIPEEQFCRSLCRAVSMWPGARLMDYICVESTLLGAGAPHYEVFVELRGLRDLSEGQRHKVRGFGVSGPLPAGGFPHL